MVDITNGITSMTVTKGAFEGIYKYQGYTLVHDYAVSPTLEQAKSETSNESNYIPEEVNATSVNLEEAAEIEPNESTGDVELLEKPISQWTKEELKEFAEANNISLEGVKSATEVRKIIKAYIDSQK